MNFLKSMLLIFLALLSNNLKAQIAMDSVVILDYKYSKWPSNHGGFSLTYVEIDGLNTITLDAADKRIATLAGVGSGFLR